MVEIPPLPEAIKAVALSSCHWQIVSRATGETIGTVSLRGGVYEAQEGDMIVATPRGFAAAVAAILRSRRGH